MAVRVVSSTDGETLQEFIREHVEPGAEVFTDDAGAYSGLTEYEHGTVRHSVGEYVDGRIHTNGIESLWSMLKRAHKGIYHKLSPKHLQRYVDEFGDRQNIRKMDTPDQMTVVAAWLVGKRPKYWDLDRAERAGIGGEIMRWRYAKAIEWPCTTGLIAEV